MKRLFGLDLPISVAQVKQDTNFVELLEQHPWLNQVRGCVGMLRDKAAQETTAAAPCCKLGTSAAPGSVPAILACSGLVVQYGSHCYCIPGSHPQHASLPSIAKRRLPGHCAALPEPNWHVLCLVTTTCPAAYLCRGASCKLCVCVLCVCWCCIVCVVHAVLCMPAPQSKLVVKPDMLFGQRGKHDLVGLNLTYDEAESFVKARMGKQVGGCRHVCV